MPDIETIQTDGVVREVRDLVESYVKAEVISVTEPGTGVEALVIRSGNSVHQLPPGLFDQFRDEPRFRHGTAALLSLDSLIDHVVRFKDSDSVIFADDDRTKPSLTAVLDYHVAGGALDGAAARFGKHRSTFGFPLSDEWKAWAKMNGEVMTMTDFAAFLEDRVIDVYFFDPAGRDQLPDDIGRMVEQLGGAQMIASPNKLMELARGLQVNEASVVAEAINLASGEGVVRFEATHTDASGAPLKVPSLFLIVIPVFRNGPVYRIAARLRYRKANGKIAFWYELWRTDRTFDHAFGEALGRVREETGLPVLLGKPEA